MIWIYLSKNEGITYNSGIIEWTRTFLQKNNIIYRIVFKQLFLFDSDVSQIEENDYIFWNPLLASKNLEYVKQYKKSIVVLEQSTALPDKLSEKNPVNENLAINYGFYLMYLNETDNVNTEWRLVAQIDDYLLKQSVILDDIMKDRNNFRSNPIVRQENVDTKNTIIKNQVNLG